MNNRDGYVYGQSVRGADADFKKWVLGGGYKKETLKDEEGNKITFTHKSRIFPKELHVNVTRPGSKRFFCMVGSSLSDHSRVVRAASLETSMLSTFSSHISPPSCGKTTYVEMPIIYTPSALLAVGRAKRMRFFINRRTLLFIILTTTLF